MIPPGFPETAFTRGHPHALYTRLRARPTWRLPDREQVQVLARYAEVRAVASDPEAYRSGDGILLSELGHTYDSPPTIMHTDPPGHPRYRAMVAPAFRPSLVRSLEGAVRDRARALLDAGPRELVADLAAPLPLQVICLLLGIPEDDWPRFFRWSEAIVPDAADLPAAERTALRTEAGRYLVEQAHRTTEGVAAELAAAGLSDVELVMFLIQLLVAGNETTRHAISGGLAALADEQWTVLRAEPSLIPRAVEEILRWTSPVVYFLRTATRDTELAAEGEHLMLLYGSANLDEAEFGRTAGTFDMTRDAANLAFGFGPHFCLGAALARLELRVLLEELLRYPTLTVGPLTYNGSSVVTGPRHAPLTLR